MPINLINLYEWSLAMNGAIQLLTKLHDDNVNLLPMMGKESKVYSEALYKALSNPDGMYDFLCGKELQFKDHKRDKKGKLVSCVAYFV